MSSSDGTYSESASASASSSSCSSEEELDSMIPTQEELLALEVKRPYVRRLKDGDLVLTSSDTLEWRLVRRDSQFLLVELEGDMEREEGVQLTSSLEDYEEVLLNNGDDSRRGLRMFLSDLMMKTEHIEDEGVIDLACAWLVQLSHDTDSGESQVFHEIEELRDDLHNLIIIAMSSTYD